MKPKPLVATAVPVMASTVPAAPPGGVGKGAGGRRTSSHCDDEMFNIHGAFMMGSHFATMMPPPELAAENPATVTMAKVLPPAPVVMTTTTCSEKLSGKKRPHSSVESVETSGCDKDSIRRQKHKEVEIRRRQRISNLFDELKETLQCPASDRSSILSCALDKIRSCEDAVQPAVICAPVAPISRDEQQCAVALEELHACQGVSATCDSGLDHHAILKELPTPVIVCTSSQEVLFVNNTFTRQFGFTLDDFKNAKALFEVLAPCCNARQLFGQCCDGMIDMFRVNSEINLKGDGRRGIRIVGSMNFSKGSPSYVTMMFERL
jgi:PAS domain-containing protein